MGTQKLTSIYRPRAAAVPVAPNAAPALPAGPVAAVPVAAPAPALPAAPLAAAQQVRLTLTVSQSLYSVFLFHLMFSWYNTIPLGPRPACRTGCSPRPACGPCCCRPFGAAFPSATSPHNGKSYYTMRIEKDLSAGVLVSVSQCHSQPNQQHSLFLSLSLPSPFFSVSLIIDIYSFWQAKQYHF